MRKPIQLALGAMFAFALCMMTSCEKVEEITNPTKYGRIQGIVTDANTSEPIQGVNISLSPTGASAVTGSDGRYEFADLEVGQYTVQGMKTGYETNTKSIVIADDAVASGDMQLRPAITGFNLSVEYLDFGSHFSTLTFKIINRSTTTPMSWEIFESLNWLAVTPNTGNLQGGQEVTLTVTIDRSLIYQNTTGNITVHSADMEKILPISVSL
ncbi:MAG: carboxypeptidase-like regulatory domain-containing protein [Bacteroidales bacterium]|nr:carboxypeptidase-like regulatory domain-containing protein [Bacteroidales bacterium]